MDGIALRSLPVLFEVVKRRELVCQAFLLNDILDWISGKMSLLQECSGTGPGCPPSLGVFKTRAVVALQVMV